jgi:uncharacterized protein (TIGR02466 family)
MPVEQWFSTPIYYDYALNKDLIQTELTLAYNNSNFSKAAGWGTKTHSVSDPTFSSNIIEDMNLIVLRNEIYNHIINYMKSLNSTCTKQFRIASSWFTNTKPGEYTRIHNHRYADISGVYYLKTNTLDGSLTFVSPSPCLTSVIFAEIRDTVSYTPEEGKIILFPGWLYHVVGENDTDDTRISVSFNIYFER